MKKVFLFALLPLLLSPQALGDAWSLGVHTGPFVFGDFVERTLRLGTGEGPADISTLTLSAGTRAGLAVDLERSFSDRFGARLEASFTRSSLSVKTSLNEGVDIEAGDLDVTTVMLPLIWRINPRGTFRFHVMGGPAYAMYEIERRAPAPGGLPLFEGTRNEWGIAGGGGVGWWFSDSFAVEGQLVDIITSSPFERDDFPANATIEIQRPHNVHTTVGVRWRF